MPANSGWLRRSVSTLGAGLVVVFLLVACFPISGNGAPVALSVQGDEVIFHWCGESTQEYKYLEVSFATFDSERNDELAFSASGAFNLETGDEFSASALPAGAVGAVENSIPIDERKILVFVNTGSSYDDLDGFYATFPASGLKNIGEQWLYPSGEMQTLPCEMRGAE
jgi:hypothetical protein